MANTSDILRAVTVTRTNSYDDRFGRGRKIMAAHAGEKAQETGDFRCQRCHQKTHVSSGRAERRM